MLLTIDAGNTNITLGVFDQKDGDRLRGPFRMTTKIDRTSDEYGVHIREILRERDINPADIHHVIISSVVPKIMHSLTSGIMKYFDTTPIVVNSEIPTGIRIATEHPEQIGADRIVDAAGAYALHGGPVLVVDFGTATTYDLVSPDGAFVAGVTAPGIRISAQALWEKTAKLPEIELKRPASILARETVSSMQAGLIFGQIGQAEYIVRRMIEESGYENVRVIATGGLGRIIANETDCIDIYDPNLTLVGMKRIFDLQKSAL